MRILRLVRCFSLALLIMAIPAFSFAGVFISVTVAPPALPVYAQPPCPGDGYIWTPGYWAYGPAGYYWVPGTWVMPPTVGLLWTPGYWGWSNGAYIWHVGYWGPHIGFYGGVNYGYGYFGSGYEGGYWRGHRFYYNRTVNNITITNVHIYNRMVVNRVTVNHTSYNGGPHGIRASETRDERRAAEDRHFEATEMQRQHEHGAGNDRAFWASENHGRPGVAATERPGEFHGPRATPARDAGPPRGHMDNHPAPRPQDSARHDERPMPREETHGGHGAQIDYSGPRHEGPPHESAYHPENGRGHENAPHQGGQGHPGHEQRPR